MDATAFCSNHVWKRWFWPQKLSMNATRFESAFWNAVYSKSAFWNAVYSKISMDATAFCSNHVWKRWFWPQKLSINAPLEGRNGMWTMWAERVSRWVNSSTPTRVQKYISYSWVLLAQCITHWCSVYSCINIVMIVEAIRHFVAIILNMKVGKILRTGLYHCAVYRIPYTCTSVFWLLWSSTISWVAMVSGKLCQTTWSSWSWLNDCCHCTLYRSLDALV